MTSIAATKHRYILPTLSLATAGCLWGTGFFFGKIALSEMTVTENVCFRFVCASFLLAPALVKQWTSMSKRDLGLLTLAAIVGVPVQFLVQFKGLQLTTVSHAALIVGTLPVLLALSSAIFLKERLHHLEWIALTLSAAGVFLISLPAGSPTGVPQPALRGDVLVFISMLTAVFMILSTKQLMARHNPLFVTASMIILGTVILITWTELSLPVRFHFSSKVWMAALAQGVLATVGAFVLWNWGLSHVSASRSGVFLNLEPVVGTVLGVSILGERLGIAGVIGGLMILGAAVFFSTRSHSQ